ncbi:MAG: fibrinogen-like YCDxxxxGGGW domain-containing protein [Elusimicrobiota bacterium]
MASAFITAFLFAAPSARAADIPSIINFQGRLLEAGQPVTGTRDLSFAVYGSADGSDQLWTETQAGVSVNAGVFSVHLGAAAPLPAEIFNAAELYLEIQANGKTLSPRERLAASPYAFNAQRLQGLEPASFAAKEPDGSLEMGNKQITGFRVENAAAAPVPCDEDHKGYIYFNTMDGTFYGCNGARFKSLSDKPDVEGCGETQDTAGRACKDILDTCPGSLSGAYWIDPNEGDPTDAFQVYCDMGGHDGGWTLVAGISSGDQAHVNSASVSPGNLISPSGKGKLADSTINLINSNTDPAYRLTCAGVTGFFQGSCVFSATTAASGPCVAVSYSYPPTSYVGTTSQPGNNGLADGNSGYSNRLIYGAPGVTGCDTGPTGWGQDGTLYVR